MSLLIEILDSTVIRTNPIDTNSNSSLADNLTVYFGGQGTQLLPCGKIPKGEGAGGRGYGLTHGLLDLR